MGEQQVKSATNPKFVRKFIGSVLNDLKALEIMLESGMVESGVQRIGAEQELCMVDEFWQPAPIIMPVLEALQDDNFTTELASFNLEFNLPPLPFSGSCLADLEAMIHAHLDKLASVLSQYEARYVLTGILPTIRQMDLELKNMTPRERYKMLFDALRKMRGRPFEYRIRGSDELLARQEYPTFEFCNTSFQVHLQVSPEKMVDSYNFAKLITAPVLATCTNSPLLLGKRLWRETRIALFQQAVDTRNVSGHMRDNTARVSFSRGWVRDSVLEIFKDDIARFRVLIGTNVKEKSLEKLAAGEMPNLDALRIFNGTVYRWNRACFGMNDGIPHLRIENRVIPAGPTVVDEVANAAFWLGLMNGMPDDYLNLYDKIDFDWAVNNFTRSARTGLDARFNWLGHRDLSSRELILKELLPIAREGLARAAVNKEDISKYLDIIEERVATKRTGSQWTLQSYGSLRNKTTRGEALIALTAEMYDRQQEGRPVSQWSLAEYEEKTVGFNKLLRVEQIMTTDLYTVRPEDLVELVANIMSWKRIRHVPVEDSKGKLIGLVTSGTLIRYFAGKDDKKGDYASVGDVMVTPPISIEPETLTVDAIAIMRESKIGCLPVVKEGKLTGIITEHDFMKVAGRMLEGMLARSSKTES